jgi:hypothetical protein
MPARMWARIIHHWWEWRLCEKLKLELLYDPAIPLLGVYVKEYKSTYERELCTPMFTATLFT